MLVERNESDADGEAVHIISKVTISCQTYPRLFFTV